MKKHKQFPFSEQVSLKQVVYDYLEMHRQSVAMMLLTYTDIPQPSIINMDYRSKDIPNVIINNLQNPDEFIQRLKDNPDLILDDACTQVTLRVLRVFCFESLRPQISNWAREILKDALVSFIPKKPRKLSSEWLTYWKIFPDAFKDVFDSYGKKIKRFVNYNITWEENKPNLEKAFQEICKRPMPKDLLSDRRINQFTTIVLAFIHAHYEIPYSALESLYYDISKIQKDAAADLALYKKHTGPDV